MFCMFAVGWTEAIAAVTEHQWGSWMCKTIQVTGISMFIIIITTKLGVVVAWVKNAAVTEYQ
jgi:hypothetical protein